MAEQIGMSFGLWWSREACIRCGANWCYLANTTMWWHCSLFCQITL